MTKALCSFPEGEREKIAKRRVAAGTGGLGYLAALAFLALKGKPKEAKPKAVNSE